MAYIDFLTRVKSNTIMKKIILTFALASSVLYGCGDSSTDTTDAPEEVVDDAAVDPGSREIPEEIINDIIQSIPSPLEISILIKDMAEYNKSMLNNPDDVTKYNTQYKQALNLGVYGTDLGYANINGKNQHALSFLSSVKKLADGLSIGQFFDYNTIKKLAESNNNLDSLILTTTTNFEKINYNLRQQKREHLSILLLTGGWVEAVYLTVEVYKGMAEPNPLLREKIGEQKIVLDQILLVLDVYKKKPNFSTLINDLSELQKIYDQIEIETIYAPPTMKEVNGTLVIVDNTTSTIKITDADIEKISSLIKSIRSKVIK